MRPEKRVKLDPGASIVNVWSRVASKKKQEPPLPIPFDLPINFQPKIREGMRKEHLTSRARGARGKFVTAIAEAMYRFKDYPTKEEYAHVARQVCKKWTL